MKVINTLKTHSGAITGIALVAYGILGVSLGKLDQSSALSDVLAGLGLLGLHLKN